MHTLVPERRWETKPSAYLCCAAMAPTRHTESSVLEKLECDRAGEGRFRDQSGPVRAGNRFNEAPPLWTGFPHGQAPIDTNIDDFWPDRIRFLFEYRCFGELTHL